MPSLLLVYGTFLVISLSGALSPGPLTALALSEGVRAGRWSGARLAVGHGLVEIPLVFAVAYGLGTWLRQPVVGAVVGLVGAAVLLWMGYGLAAGAWQGRLVLSNAGAGPVPGALRWGHIPGGVLFTLANPYWSLWWATLGAAYVARVTALNLGPLTVGGLAMTHWLTDLLWLGVLSLLVASGQRFISPKTYRAVLLVCGVFLFAFGLYFAWSGLAFLWKS
jgi:threonine/homoserine/homoserine lactone efflux protein